MYGRDGLGVFLYLWICVLDGTKVAANPNQCLTPVELDLEEWGQRNIREVFDTNEKFACVRPDVYICEEPPVLVSPNDNKTCNYRNDEYEEQVYRWATGCGCLMFIPNFLFVAGIRLTAGCLHGSFLVPCLELAKDDGTCGCYPFDPSFEEVANAVTSVLVPAAHGRWERCVQVASDCCSNYMAGNSSETDPNQCPITFDGWTCWQAAEAGTIANEVCSEFAYSGQGPTCHHFSNKECYEDATWEVQTDYSTCSIAPRLLSRYRFYIIVLSISVASCLPAVFIFFFYKRLRITRVALHRNLLIAIIIRNILVIVSRSEIYIDELLSNSGETAMSSHSVWCRALSVAERAAGNAVFVCMLVEGIYLHRLIVAVFRKKLNTNLLYAIGAVVVVVPVVAWAIVMGLHDDHSCWVVYTVDHIQWILDAPRLLILLVNTILFIDVARVLITKIRNSENSYQLNTAKATLFLMPIFGVQFILTAFRPNTTDCTGEQVYYYVAYTVEGLQGFIVAMLYCYINKEVRMLITATYKKTESAVVSRIRGESSAQRMSVGPNSDRRITFSTGLASNDDDLKDQNATITPRPHVADIISVEITERFAAILEPTCETVNNGLTNKGYDSLETLDNEDTGFKPHTESKIGGQSQDEVQNVMSPSSSDYNSLKTQDHGIMNIPVMDETEVHVHSHTEDELDNEHNDILDDILQAAENSDHNYRPVVLDPNLLCPYKKDGDDKIIFIDDEYH